MSELGRRQKGKQRSVLGAGGHSPSPQCLLLPLGAYAGGQTLHSSLSPHLPPLPSHTGLLRSYCKEPSTGRSSRMTERRVPSPWVGAATVFPIKTQSVPRGDRNSAPHRLCDFGWEAPWFLNLSLLSRAVGFPSQPHGVVWHR